MTILDIRQKLDNWKTDDIYNNSKSYKEKKSNIVPGEYVFVLSWSINLDYYGIREPITHLKKFHTQTLAPDPISDNPDADIFRLSQLLPLYDREFLQKVDEAIGKRWDEENPNGFF